MDAATAPFTVVINPALIKTVLGGAGGIAGILAFVAFRFRKIWVRLSNDDVRASRLSAKEVTAVRDKLTQLYKASFEQLRAESDAKIKELLEDVQKLRDEVQYLRSRLRDLERENDSLRRLNLSYQQRLAK